jgi:hypothetical protein
MAARLNAIVGMDRRQAHLSRNLARAQNGEDNRRSIRAVNLNFDGAVEDEIGHVPWLFSCEDIDAGGKGSDAQEIKKVSLLGRSQSTEQRNRLENDGIEERRHACSPPTRSLNPADRRSVLCLGSVFE